MATAHHLSVGSRLGLSLLLCPLWGRGPGCSLHSGAEVEVGVLVAREHNSHFLGSLVSASVKWDKIAATRSSGYRRVQTRWESTLGARNREKWGPGCCQDRGQSAGTAPVLPHCGARLTSGNLLLCFQWKGGGSPLSVQFGRTTAFSPLGKLEALC